MNRAELEYVILGNFSGFWEVVTYEETKREALDTLIEYLTNDPTHPYKVGKTSDWNA